jgi:hypothetical protein
MICSRRAVVSQGEVVINEKLFLYEREVVSMPGLEESTTSEQARAQAFVELGFDTVQALMLAATRNEGQHVDLEQVRRLLDAGCPHDLALRIVV